MPKWIRNHRAIAYEGKLGPASRLELVQVVVSDWDFVDPPTILLSPGSPLLIGGNHPHIGINGAICYRTRGIGVLNAYAPENAVAACLAQASSVIQQIHAGGKWIDDEIQREFEAYWDGIRLLSCDLDYSKQEANFFIAEDESRLHGWLYQNTKNAQAIVQSMGGQATYAGKVYVLRSQQPLSIGGTSGIPQDIKKLLQWLHGREGSLEKKVLGLISRKEFFDKGSPLIVIHASNATIGFQIDLNSTSLKKFAKCPREFPHRARHPYFPPLPITRFAVKDSSPEFIYARNGQQSLRGKRITLIGAGAIGGYLADNLVRMGAGYAGGRLTIIDPDVLQPDNIGRHRLGMDNVLKNKASALVGRLGTEFPWLKLHALETDVRKCHDLFSADLVIDVTGEEALGRVINRLHLSATGPESKIPPVLYCWIAGEGDGAQAIWVDRKGKHACWECLLQHGNNGDWEARFRFVRNESKVTIVGCAAVTPYAVSSAMSAAALASEMISDWLTDKIDPRFRSRARTHGDTFLLRDSSPLLLKGCPACGGT